MNIVQVNSHYAYSSIGRTTTEMHEYLQKHNINSHVFCMNYCDENENIHKVLNRIEYRINGIHSRITGLQAYASHIPTIRMLKEWDNIKPDIVILRNLHSDIVNLPMILEYCANKKVPVIIVLHDCWFFTGHCTHYTKIHCNKWLTECKKCPGLKEGNPTWFFDRSNRVFKDRMRLFHSLTQLSVIGVSKWISKEATKSPLFPQHTHFQYIYNWINLDVFKPHDTKQIRVDLGLTDDFVILGIAQNWNLDKGLSIFIKAADRFPDCKVILVGNVKDEYKIMLPSNVITPGVTKSTEVLSDYYSLADVYLNPTIQESFGKVTAEALSCGTPVVANDSTATPELVGDCGFIVHNNNIDDIFRGIEVIRQNGKASYTAKCRERAQTLFDKEKNLQEYVVLFSKLLEK